MKKFHTKKLINLSRKELSVLKKLSKDLKANQSEVLRQGLKLMANKKPKGAQIT